MFLGNGVVKSHFGMCSPVNLLHIFRTLLPKDTCGGLLLKAEFKVFKNNKERQPMKSANVFYRA